MHLVIFGLTVSSSWGNGHATHWRSIIRALALRGHEVTFFERDVPYYAAHRDLQDLPYAQLVLYRDWPDIAARARRDVQKADASIVTSYCPDALAATYIVHAAPGVRCFYDMDTPVTLERLARGEAVEYIPSDGLRGFDVVLSFTGGTSLDALRHRLGAREVAPLYGTIDADEYLPGSPRPEFAATLSHIGTYSPDRDAQLTSLFLDVARRQPDRRFLIAGPKYPPQFNWLSNLYYMEHVSPNLHRDFYASCEFTLNITRGAMAKYGYCPQGRLFEAAACEAVVISDRWDGLEQFFDIGGEIKCASNTDEVLEVMQTGASERKRIGRAARARVLAHHTAAHRAQELERLFT